MVSNTELIPAIKTDHSVIYLEFENIDKNVKGPGFWKLNCSVLNDGDYVAEITKMIPIWTAEGERELSDHCSTWDWIKYNVRAYSTNYSKKKAKVRNEQEKDLQKDLDDAKVSFETNPTDSNGNLLNTAKEKLETFYEEKVKGVIIRAQAQWHEHSEKSRKHFLNLEKRKHVEKHICKLAISGVITKEPFSFYQNEFTL